MFVKVNHDNHDYMQSQLLSNLWYTLYIEWNSWASKTQIVKTFSTCNKVKNKIPHCRRNLIEKL